MDFKNTGKKNVRYRRILLKLSGEALMGDQAYGIDPKVLKRLADEIKLVYALGVEVALVIGGGNLFRGMALSQSGLDRITGDHMGMLGTLMNALALRDVFEREGILTRILSAIPMSGIVDHHDRRKAIYHLIQSRLVIFAAGTGNPLVTTDTAASLRAIEIKADAMLKATHEVDGIYTEDPKLNPDAKLYGALSYKEALKKELGIMDLAAFCQCRDHNIPIHIFNMHKPGALLRVVQGMSEGTVVNEEGVK
jgi:uridylate kinase